LDKLQTVVNAPILDIRQQIKKILDQKITKKYVVLGSPLTIKKGLYDFNGHQRIPLTNDIYMKLTDIINHINSGSNVAYFRSLLEEMIDTYANNGENTVILGCTELSLYSENDNPYTINSIDALVNMVIDNLHSLEKIQKSEF
jgi:aspartate/glutamate racemase